ncbi:methyl-accepting chemotaxis protein [Butyrivibrio sp. VCD2006]|uniref:methyl-accepting chemotaxis protein n=1 Tax=Butyrivibrio sp. VCD2006 TaxID=1280664 RepID=UPI0004086BD9|nr:methyl-accepting chemotaxis protein [Butyrivibrio sp. VCD2006]
MSKEKTQENKGNFIQSVKGKILVMGSLGIAAALVIGLVGIISINRNAQNSEVVSTVDEINILQAKNIGNDALYQYYVDESYLNATLTNLDEMEQSAQRLKKIGDPSYQSSIDSILEKIASSKTNFSELQANHSSRGYARDIGKYQEYIASSDELSESFTNLVNNNDWVEITWIDSNFGVGATPVNIDGKQYMKYVYERELPVVGKRNSLTFRVGGTFTYKGDYYIKNIALVNGSEKVQVDLTALETMEKSGDGLENAEFADFDGERAIKVTGKFNETNGTWEEVSTSIDAKAYDMEKFPVLYYELYVDPSVYTQGAIFKYGGAIQGVYGFASNLSTLDDMTDKYSKLVVEGKDVSASLAEIENLFAEIGENIPKYTTDPSLAEISSASLATKKALFDELKNIDVNTLAIKADNSVLNSDLSQLCESVQNQAVDNMNAVRSSVTVIIILVLIASIVVLVYILLRVSIGINRSVKSFQSAIENIETGNIKARADESGHDEFAMFAESLNTFLDILETTITKVKHMSDVLADSGLILEESATKTKTVASEINETINEISKGAAEQATDIEASSQRVFDIRNNIQQILSSVSTLSDKSSDMRESGKEATSNMDNLTKSSDSTNAAFGRIIEQVKKTDESVSKIQEAVTLISSVANQINLLSLNASIEAARAGDAGKGFAVVASEISNLADSTNQSTTIIEGIIRDLSEESNKTVQTINEVTELIENQKTSISSTSAIFGSVSDNIEFTKEAVETVLGQAESSDKAGETVVDLMTNLSAISQENAASAETTSSAMTKLNDETARLAETSAELKGIADTLKDDLQFFKV